MKLVKTMIVTALLAVGATQALADPNLTQARRAAPQAQPLPGGALGMVFPGPADSFAINLNIRNDTSRDISLIVVAGKRGSQCVNRGGIVWDSFGSFSGPASATVSGEDSTTVVIRLTGFSPGETISFSGIDPDCADDPSAGITVGGIAGSLALAFGGGIGFDRFESDGSNTIAILE
jgi:hypothetical protein